MSVDQAFREMIRAEIAVQLQPLQKWVNRLEAESDNLELLGKLAVQLQPLAAMFGVKVAAAPAARAAKAPRNVPAARPGRRGRPPKTEGKVCAIIGCGNPARSKGYCSAHYQKLRMLIRTNRRPSEWIDDASPSSVQDVVLPRGRAASKALAAMNKG